MSNKNNLIDELLSYLELDKTNWYFIWIKNPGGRAKLGQRAGCRWSGYDAIVFKGCRFYVHILIWYKLYGVIPTMIDHDDGNKSNNNPLNLKLTNFVLNGRNRIEHRSGKPVGICWRKDTNMWIAQGWKNKKKFYLGRFKTMEEASQAFKEFDNG